MLSLRMSLGYCVTVLVQFTLNDDVNPHGTGLGVSNTPFMENENRY